MINLLSLSLIITSLAFAQVWSPNPEITSHQEDNDVIVKEGHRVIVVEYDLHGKTNTKVSIKPQHDHQSHVDGDQIHHHHTPTELICDAFGKCTHEIANAIGRTKDKTAETTRETAEETAERARETVEETKESVESSYERLKEKASRNVHDFKDGAHGVRQNAAKKAQDTADRACEAVDDTKEVVEITYERLKEKAHDFKDSAHGVRQNAAKKAQDVKEHAKDRIESAKDRGKEMAEDISRNVEEQIESAKNLADKVKSGASQLLSRSFHSVINFLRYITSPQAFNGLMVILNLLGFATAYGMCVWVTFVSSYVLAGSLPRQQFGLVQSKIYPVYFKVMAYSIALALLGHVFVQRRKIFTDKAVMFQCYNLVTSILMVLTNLLVLEPRATKAMFERMKIEKEEGKGIESHVTETGRVAEPQRASDPAVTTTTTTETQSPAHTERSSDLDAIRSKIVKYGQRLKKLNSYSSILNISTMMALSWHLVYLAQRLLETC